MADIKPEATFRTPQEQEAAQVYARLFSESPDGLEVKLSSFAKYIRRQDLTRLLTLYELFKMVVPIKGSVVECGVYRGSSLMAWANFSAVLEPTNLTRRIYGFDTFSGLTGVADKDRAELRSSREGELASDCYEELLRLISVYDSNRFLGHIPKVHLIKGDARLTIPEFMKTHPHLVVSLLFLDLDLYEPTKVAIEHFAPRMPKGAVIAFDDLDNPIWPGETLALLETIGIGPHRLERLLWDPYIAYVIMG